ncbi:MAG: tetratricopeptide repeat protein [Terriglobales bacterium]
MNREGVEAIRKHQYGKAKALFYKAYLYDPGDPFTLNNLGYISELEGDAESAQNFYSLASALPSAAIVDRASAPGLRGESLQSAILNVHNLAMQINRANIEAVRLLSDGRAPEADHLLQRTLALDPRNGFTLNNLGVAKESEGDFEAALKYYTSAADSASAEGVVVTRNSVWRGKPVRALASENAKRLNARMQDLSNAHAKAAELNLQGVSAINRNDLQDAIQKFSQAYRLDPNNAFSLNNQGYLAEIDGDLETAQEFYRKAQRATEANARVALASRPKAEGMALTAVADQSEGHVADAIETANAASRRRTGPIQLKRRDNTPVLDSSTPLQPSQPDRR